MTIKMFATVNFPSRVVTIYELQKAFSDHRVEHASDKTPTLADAGELHLDYDNLKKFPDPKEAYTYLKEETPHCGKPKAVIILPRDPSNNPLWDLATWMVGAWVDDRAVS